MRQIFNFMLSITCLMLLSASNSATELDVSNHLLMVQFSSPENMEIRRREGGVVDPNNLKISTQRGVARGVARGLNRGVARGVSRGVSRGVARGAEIIIANPPKIIAPISTLHTAYSAQSQPELYWFLSDAWKGDIYFSINLANHAEPIYESKLSTTGDNGFAAGFHQLSLKQLHLKLEPNQEYEWFVYIILDEVERSADFLASATIIYKSLSEQAVLNNIIDKTKFYAQRGYWYDMMSIVFSEIKKPDNKNHNDWLAVRTDLLNQVKMPLVAQFQD